MISSEVIDINRDDGLALSLSRTDVMKNILPGALWSPVTVVSSFKCFTTSVDRTRALAHTDRFHGEKSTAEGVLARTSRASHLSDTMFCYFDWKTGDTWSRSSYGY